MNELTPKEIFSMVFYGGLKDAINSISDEEAKDMYICKLIIDNMSYGSTPNRYYDLEDVHLEYNTNTVLQEQINEINCNWEKYNTGERVWGWTFGGKDKAIVRAKTENLFFTDELHWGWISIDIPFFAYKSYLEWKTQTDYTDTDEATKNYEFSAIHFKNEMIELAKKLFEEKVILQKFGENIAFIVECIEDEEDPINVSGITVA